MREEVDQVEVLQEEGTRGAYSLRGIWIEDWRAVGGGVDRRVVVLWMAHRVLRQRGLGKVCRVTMLEGAFYTWQGLEDGVGGEWL